MTDIATKPVTPHPKVLDLRNARGKLKRFRILTDRQTALHLELIEAALCRCETIAKDLDISSRYGGMNDFLWREEALRPYLERFPDEAHLALAMAKGDVAHYRSLRAATWNVLSLQPILKLLALPALLILLTALLGQYIGTSLQDRAFQRQRVFELKRDRLIQGQERAVDLYNDLVRLQSSLSVREKEQTINTSDLADVRNFSGRIEKLRALGEGLVDNKSSNKVLGDAAQELSTYAACLKRGRPDQTKPTCSHAFDLGKFNSVIYQFSDALIEFTKNTQ